ncbi:MAG: tyrosine-type recombinase/integrase [Polyangiales bacterium]
MSVYQRVYADKRVSEDWYVSWYVGNKQYKKRIGPNKRAAELYEKDIDLKRVRGELLGIKEERRILFPALADEYLAWARPRKAKHTVEDEESAIRRFKIRFTGIASKIIRSDIERFLSDRLTTDKIGPCRHNKDLKFLRLIFTKAQEWGYSRRNPTLGIKRLKEPPGRVRFLTTEERDALLAACPERLRTIVLIALNTGLRKSELLTLRWHDLDFKNRMIRVERSKNGERRDVPMTGTVHDLFQRIPRRVDTAYVFANPDGTPQADTKTAWGNALRRSGIQDFTFHDLRHTFASNLVMNGVDIRTVQTLLGHKDITMTMRYAHLSPEHLRDAISVLDENPVPSTQPHETVSTKNKPRTRPSRQDREAS